ncbi:hypothetical protein ACFQ05_21245 [Amycolatopsis umgeniensis]|uniref:Bulb-type lectin domain-containing protein n=1 Tax=Amycolatopsis umgeniensis TaxID=336628 RepID=A0A841BFM8_9PSEU|nr:hypothetical protein [Amycolatopsis umgeniensis]MBB5858147.1 hypothetical protein [Amycolatopsis umgeniensis]
MILTILLLVSVSVTVANPAHAVQPFNNAGVADAGLAELGTSRPTGWNQPGECIKSVQRWVAAAGGSFGGGGVVSGYANSGAQEVSLQSAVKGDVIQYTNANGNDQDWSHAHTMVVIANHGNGRFDVVQSNSPPGTGLVTRADNAIPAPATGWVARAWRFGTLPSGSAPYPGVGTAMFKGKATLSAGEYLHPNEYIASENGQTVLIMQSDGNLVLYRGNAAALWSSGTSGHPGARAIVQTDGNIVIYSATSTALWWTGTTDVTTLVVQSDGNLVGYSAAGSAAWQAGTGGQDSLTFLGSDHLSAGQQIHPRQYIKSADNRYFLVAQNDGNIVLYGPGYHVLWTTNTGGHIGGAYLVVQNDGNVVVYSASNTPLWWTGTNSTVILWLQTDGNLVGRNSADGPTWTSGTSGRI